MTEPRPLPYPWDDVRGRLQAKLWDVLLALKFSKKDLNGDVVTPLNPTRADKHKGSFVIFTGGRRPGSWRDFSTGEGGDLFDLIIYIERLQGKTDAYWRALDILHLGRGVVRTVAQDQQDRERRERDQRAAEAKRAADEGEKSAALFKRWLALAPIAGTVAETYLREARGIDLSRLPHPPGALRFAPALDHTDRETGEVTTWPCMVAAMTRGAKVAAIHRTWLAPDGGGKAPVAKAKMMLGPAKGAAIRLSSGPSGLSPTAAAAKKRGFGPLIIGEGIETVLTGAVARPDYRAWAGGSLDHMALIEWPTCATAVILMQDNDLAVEAKAAFGRVLAHWQRQADGRPIKVAASRMGSDFNDWVA